MQKPRLLFILFLLVLFFVGFRAACHRRLIHSGARSTAIDRQPTLDPTLDKVSAQDCATTAVGYRVLTASSKFSSSLAFKTFRDRREDLEAVIAELLLSHREFQQVIDSQSIGAAGHSLAGYMVVGLAAGWPSWFDPRIREPCWDFRPT